MKKPRLLFLTHRFPYPPDRGEKIRGYYLVRHLARRFDVFLGAIVDDPADFTHMETMRGLCAEVEGFAIDKGRKKREALARIRPGRPLMLDYYRHAGLHRWADEVVAREQIGLAYVLCTAMAPYVLHRPMAKLLDMTDIDSEKWAEYARKSRFPMSAVWAREARTLLAYERRAVAGCDMSFLVTNDEVRRFLDLAPEAAGRVACLENGVDLERFAPSAALANPFPDSGPNIVLVGNMDYWPNSDAACWFAREVFPAVRARAPSARFWVVGSRPGEEVLALARLPGVEVTGRVPAVQPYLAHASVAVCPLRIARGIQNKVLEAMAMGCPVVASPQAFEGVRAMPGRDLLVADGATAIAGAVSEVLEGRHQGLGAAGRRVMEDVYSWEARLSMLDPVLQRFGS